MKYGQNILLSYFGCFVKLILSCKFRSVLSFGIDSSVDLGMSTFVLRITETVLSLFAAEFFWNEIPFSTLAR